MNEDYRNVYGWIRVKIWWTAFVTLKLSNVVSLMSVCGRLFVSISVRCPFGHVYSFKCNSQVFPVVTVVSLFSVCTFLYLICGSSSGGFFCCVKCVGGCMLRFPHIKPCLNTPCKVCLRVCLSACQSVFFSLLSSSSPPLPVCGRPHRSENVWALVCWLWEPPYMQKANMQLRLWTNIYEPCILKRSCGKMFTKGNVFFFLEGVGMYEMAIKFVWFLPHSLAHCSYHP